MARGGEQEADDAVIVGSRLEAPVVMQHGRHDARGAVGRRGHHLAARGIFLVDGERVDVDPIERMHGTQRIAAHELAIQFRRAPSDAEHARQQALRIEAAAHAILHDLPDAHEPGANLGLAAPGALARQHEFVDLQTLRPCRARASARRN